MTRDPSDGSVREKPAIGIPITESTQPLMDTNTSGLPITKAKAAYLERLEESRKWLKGEPSKLDPKSSIEKGQ